MTTERSESTGRERLTEKLERIGNFTSECPLIRAIENVSDFGFVVRYVRALPLGTDQMKEFVASFLMNEVAKLVTEKRLYELEYLRVNHESSEVSVVYNDSEFHFKVAMDDKAFAVFRTGSSLSDFLKFYSALVPSLPELFRSTVRFLSDVSNTRISIDPYGAEFRYGLKLRDFETTGLDSERVLNYRLMERLFSDPGNNKFNMADLGVEALSRIDLSYSGFRHFAGKMRNVVIKLDAPANEIWSHIDIDAVYRCITYSDAGGVRRPFEPEVLEEWDVALIDMFRDLVLNRFVRHWLRGVDFKTSR